MHFCSCTVYFCSCEIFLPFPVEVAVIRVRTCSRRISKKKLRRQCIFRLMKRIWKISKIGEEKNRSACQFFFGHFAWQFFWTDNVGRSLWRYWHLPSWTKTTVFFINLRFNYFKVFTVGVESFFRPFQPRPEERKKLNFWKEPQRRPYTIINFPSSQKQPFPACFLSLLRTGENSRGIDDQVKVEEEISDKPLLYRKKLSKTSREWLGIDAKPNDSLSDSSYLFLIQRILQNEVIIARTKANSILDLG